MLKQITYEYIMYTFLLFHSTLQEASNTICSPCCYILPLFQGSTFTYSFIHSTIFYSTSAICQTLFQVLQEDTIVNKADNSSAFMEIKNDEEQELNQVDSQRRLEEGTFDQRAIEVKKHGDIQGKSIPGRGKSTCKDPKMPACSKKEASNEEKEVEMEVSEEAGIQVTQGFVGNGQHFGFYVFSVMRRLFPYTLSQPPTQPQHPLLITSSCAHITHTLICHPV